MDITRTNSGTYIISGKIGEFDTPPTTKESAALAVLRALNLPFLPFDTEMEIHEGRGDVVIFTHLPSSFYTFDNFEDVIAACKESRAESSALYYYDDEYILSVPFPDVILSEFSRKIDTNRNFDAFLSEHGKLIIAFDAVNFVKNTF